MLFSQRKGLTPALKDQQIEGIDTELRNRLWNTLQIFLWDNFKGLHGSTLVDKSNFEVAFFLYWHDFFKLPIDKMPDSFKSALGFIRSSFFKFPWYRVYDFIEFSMIAGTAGGEPPLEKGFAKGCNRILEEETSAFRIIKNKVVQITSEDELQAIEEALAKSEIFPGVKTHLSSALDKLSDRENPDYRNSIKESISAVESACQSSSLDTR